MLSDLRLAFRQLSKSPGFTAIALLTLALGIGANTAIFSVINSVLLQPLPFAQPEQLVQIWQSYYSGEPGLNSPFIFKQWRDHSNLLGDVAMHTSYENASATLTGDHAPEFMDGLYVSASYLRVLRVVPILGHDFPPGADTIGGQNKVVLLSHRMWQTRFHGDPDVINRSIILDQIPHTIIGVLPASGIPRSDVLFLRPFVLDDPTNRHPTGARAAYLSVTGRLKPGVTPQQLATELGTLQRTLREQLPADLKDIPGPFVIPFREELVGTMRPTLMMLLGVGSLLLLIACANVANLLLVRATARQKEMAVRMALGAGVRRIIGQVLTESLVLSLCGAGLAVILALFAVEVLGPVTEAVQPGLSILRRALREQLLGSSLPAMLQPQVDWAVLMYSVALAVVTSVASGLIPALRSCRVDLVRDLKQSGHGSSGGRSRMQSILVGAQIGLATMLLVGSGLLLRSLDKALSVDPGFDAPRAVGFDLVTPQLKYPDTERAVRLGADAIRVLSALPGVEAVGTTSLPPLRGVRHQEIGLPEGNVRDDLHAFHSAIAGDYFRALGIPLLRGRTFTETDNLAGAPKVVILSETLARALFGEKDPIGLRVFRNGSGEVVGVVRDVREFSLEVPSEIHFYVPSRALPRTPTVIVRTKRATHGILKSIRAAIVSIDPDQPLANLRPLEEDIERTLRGRRAMLGLVLTFAMGALFLACIGVYGVMAFTVSQRYRELGIRMALGATQSGVLAMVLRQGMRLALIGLGAGLIAAVAGARAIESLLFGVSAYDPIVFIAVALALAAAAAGACWLPARRATRVDPIVALRAD